MFRRVFGCLAASFIIFLTRYRRLRSIATRKSIERQLQKRMQFSCTPALRSRRQTAIIRRACTRQWKNTNHIDNFSGRRRSLHKSSRRSHRRCAQEIFSFRPRHFELQSRRTFSSHPGVLLVVCVLGYMKCFVCRSYLFLYKCARNYAPCDASSF